MPIDEEDDKLLHSPQERGDALYLIKVYAREGYMKTEGATEQRFEDIWRTAFFVEDVDPTSED
jgi:hypothetical protein